MLRIGEFLIATRCAIRKLSTQIEVGKGMTLLLRYFLSWAVVNGGRSGVSRVQLITIRKWISVLMLVLAVGVVF